MIQKSNQQNIELSLIRDDIEFYLELANKISQKSSGYALMFGILPYLSLLTVETYQYIQNELPDYAKTLQFEHLKIIRASRMRVKLFDNEAIRVSGGLELLDQISDLHKNYYMNQHTGLTSWLRRSMQPDLGIFTYNNHIIGSTHTGIFLTGLTKEELIEIKDMDTIGKQLNSMSFDIGKFLGQVILWPEFGIKQRGTVKHFNEMDNLYHVDLKAKRFFGSIFEKQDLILVNFSLFLLFIKINFIESFIQPLYKVTNISLFRMKFISIYHFVSSLKKLQNYTHGKYSISLRSMQFFQEILKDKDLKQIVAKSDLRNFLVHYKIPASLKIPSKSSVDLNNVIESCIGGWNFNEFENQIDEQLVGISQILEEWLDWKVNPKNLHSF